MKRTRTKRRLSLVEVIIAVALMTVVFLGIAATISTAQVAQANVKERMAATAAASAKLEEILSISRQVGGFDTIDGYHQTGFHVHHSPDEVGYVAAGTTAAMPLPPASIAAYPAGRPVAAQPMAGYAEIIPVPGRTDLKEARVVVGWQSLAGNGSDDVVLMTVRIAR